MEPIPRFLYDAYRQIENRGLALKFVAIEQGDETFHLLSLFTMHWMFACSALAIAAASSSSSLLATTSNVLPGIRAVSAVLGESAVIDNETGRILWEGGSSNTLVESIAPKLRSAFIFGAVPHLKASIVTLLLFYAASERVADLLRNAVRVSFGDSVTKPFLSVAIHSFLQRVLAWPRYPSSWFVPVLLVLYLAESFFCSTRQYLSQTVHDADAYIEKLRRAQPVVEWKVRSFHYESSLASILNSHIRTRDKGKLNAIENSSNPSHLQWKRVTRTAKGYYTYAFCKDRTIAGVWKRATALQKHRRVHFTKIGLTKCLLLRNTKSRLDYFQQQRRFLATEHSDKFAEFSTGIHISGYHSRVFAVPPGFQPFWASQTAFWVFTGLGLTVPYRRWLSAQCDEVRVRVVKETDMDENASSNTWFATKKVEATDEALSFRSTMQLLDRIKADGTATALSSASLDA